MKPTVEKVNCYRRVVFTLLALLLVLGACSQEPREPKQPLDFGTDPRILRGNWRSETAGHQFVLQTEASLPTEDGYTITGTFSLDNSGQIPIEGFVQVPVIEVAGSDESLTPIFSPVYAESEDEDWILQGYAPEGSPLAFGLYIEHEDEAYMFNVIKSEAIDSLLRG